VVRGLTVFDGTGATVRTLSVKPTGDALLMQLILEVAPESSVLVSAVCRLALVSYWMQVFCPSKKLTESTASQLAAHLPEAFKQHKVAPGSVPL
jgi:hypothetical protein